MRNFKIPCGI